MSNEREKWLKDILQQGGDAQKPEDDRTQVSGMNKAAALLGKLDSATRDKILGDGGAKSSVTQTLKEKMFSFDDLDRIDTRYMQIVLQKIDLKDLVLSLKTAKTSTKGWIFKNLSSRMADRIKDDLENLGPMRVSDVQNAQQKILKAIRHLEEDGKIIIKGQGSGEYV